MQSENEPVRCGYCYDIKPADTTDVGWVTMICGDSKEENKRYDFCTKCFTKIYGRKERNRNILYFIAGMVTTVVLFVLTKVAL